MMQVATILPQAYLECSADDEYLMALGHLINRPGMEEYTNFFKRKAQKLNSFIIMDNGVIEGDPRPIQELLHNALDVGVDELVLPDSFRKSKKTMQMVSDATDYLLGTGSDAIERLQFMAVPQGESLEEWVDCAEHLLKNPLVTCLGVPKVLVDIVGRDGRYVAIQTLMERIGDLDGKQLHLLGCWKTPLEISIIAKGIEQGDLPKIRGVDSAIPYVYARAGLRLNEDDRPDSDPIDFMDGRIKKAGILPFNIAFWNDCVNMSKDKKVHYI
jgi:hypothetical protein